MARRTLITTIVAALGGGMVLFSVLAVVLTIQGTRQATLSELQRGFDRSAALATLILDQEIEGIQRMSHEIMRLRPLQQAVLEGRRDLAEHLLLRQAQFDLQGVFDGLVISREDQARWVDGGFAIYRREALLDWLSHQHEQQDGLADTRLHVMVDGDGRPHLVLVVSRHFRDPDTGRRLGSLKGAVVLSDRLSLFNRVRQAAGLEGLGWMVDGRLFVGPLPADALIMDVWSRLPSADPANDRSVREASVHIARRPMSLVTLDQVPVMVMSVADARAEARVLITVMTLLATVIVIVMSGLLLFLTRFVALPLRRLAEQARQLPVGPLRPLTTPRFHVDDELGQLVNAFNDLIRRISIHQHELDRMAHYDILTGVPNRRLLADRISQAIARARRNRSPLAICYLDLDGFKPINDRFGHAMGDRLLLVIADRLKALLRADDTLARLGGDEFVLLFNNLDDANEAHSLFERMLTAVAEPAILDSVCVRLSASMGVTFFPRDDHDADTLIRHADQAMYQAKEAGKNRYAVFDLDQSLRHQSRMEFIKSMATALQDGQFLLHYQPRVDLVSGRVTGAEALLRWQHPQRGFLLPGSFLGELNGSELESQVGRWVIEQALWQMANWKDQGLHLHISVNVSADHLLEPGFADYLEAALARHPQLPRESLECEILETATFSDLYQAGSVIARCKKLGVRFALDDFGTGYSSLAYFRSLPVDVLKVDRSFVMDMLEDPNDLDIVESIVGLAATFNKEIIAEGVESMEQAACLIRLGCRHAQGYGIARPMSPEALPAWIRQWSKRPPALAIHLGEGLQGDLNLTVAVRGYQRWFDGMMLSIQETHQLPDDLFNTRFVRWYNGSGSARYGMHEAFADLWAAHARVHELLLSLAEHKRDGAMPPQLHALLPELQAARGQMLACFARLERRGAVGEEMSGRRRSL
ncbi:diguanylate cyclase/phosphodiesterase with PAS/PAC sensor(s) [Ectothiorhodospira sp. PHS-1]|uniref:putative bifunctional diguanylate cyclase/phosphodiesterase n=1 Tax=Ectothiorhodospira sp. PHS-1 TaxID=519989 RepID=UPI00024A8532|nr:EAL domain-containing protein [Ectothiorhodospira sp. PHS-1]EHQ53429.1 diguanylate cyclase/phosphodiesterase with PAS/PAC sensor(s) [Ectothiorhodospira sp. PHS-1]